MNRPIVFFASPLWLKIVLASTLVLTLRMNSARAQDPPLQIGPTPNGPYTSYIYGNEVVDLGGPGTLYVYNTQASGGTLQLSSVQAGFLLILGIPNNDTTNLGT